MKHETKHLRRAQIIRNAILKSQAVACALVLFSLIAFTSCQDDDDFQDYTDYITGSWSTDETDVITHQQSRQLHLDLQERWHRLVGEQPREQSYLYTLHHE